MYLGPLTSESAKAVSRAKAAVDQHVWPWWAFGYKPSRRKPWRNAGRRYDIAHTIAPAVEKSVRQSIAAGLATLDDPEWADAIRAAIYLVSVGGPCDVPAPPVPEPAPVSLPPFSGYGGRCVKCGSAHASTLHRVVDRATSVRVLLGEIERPPEMECMLRTCLRCGYEWREQCADEAPLEEPVPDDAAVPAGTTGAP